MTRGGRKLNKPIFKGSNARRAALAGGVEASNWSIHNINKICFRSFSSEREHWCIKNLRADCCSFELPGHVGLTLQVFESEVFIWGSIAFACIAKKYTQLYNRVNSIWNKRVKAKWSLITWRRVYFTQNEEGKWELVHKNWHFKHLGKQEFNKKNK